MAARAAGAADAAGAAGVAGTPRPGWRAPRWLPPLAVALLLAAGLACALAGRAAAHRAATVESRPASVGVVSAHPEGDDRGPGVVWWDDHGRRRVLWLTANDIDDLPPGSLARIGFTPGGSAAELRELPRQQRGAYLSLSLVCVLAAAACAAWWRLRPRAATPAATPGERGGQASWPRPRRRR